MTSGRDRTSEIEMTTKVFVDGQEGTTGLKIFEYLSGRRDVEVLRIEEARRKCANDVAADLKGLMDRRRLMHCASDRFEILRVERERIQITVPTDGIERMMG